MGSHTGERGRRDQQPELGKVSDQEQLVGGKALRSSPPLP